MAEIALDLSLTVETQDREMEIALERMRKQIIIGIEKTVTPIEEYAGPYSVSPRFYYGHMLATKGKAMRDNVTVDAIQIYEVSNPKGGKTVTIGAI